MITFKHKGDLHKTKNFLAKASKLDIKRILEPYGQRGVEALVSATPVLTGTTVNCWSYNVSVSDGKASISFSNSNMAGNTPLVILLRYGHGTRNGGYVQGRDFISPAIQPIFDKIVEDAWKEVVSL